MAEGSALNVRLDPGPVISSSDADYTAIYAAVVEQAAELRGELDKSLAVRIAAALNGHVE